MSTPTSFLPRLPSTLRSTAQDLDRYVDKLNAIYGEPASKRKKRVALDSGYSSEVEGDDQDELVLDDEDAHAHDVFERAWSKDWLFAFIKRSDDWLQADDIADQERSARALVVEKAVALVATLSKITDSSSMVRQIPLPTQHDAIDVTLYDALPSPSDPTSVGLQTWGSAILLARRMATDLARFGIDRLSRVCELGAGSGLLSIAWAKLAEQQGQHVEVVATDFHADVLSNLARNIKSNALSSSTIVEAFKLDWEAVHASASFAKLTTDKRVHLPFPFDEPFDSIVAADVVYGQDHARWLKSCVEQFLVRGGSFHLMVPLRPTHARAIATIGEVFPDAGKVDDSYEGVVVRSMEEVERTKGIGRADEQGYRLYEIVWHE